MDISKLAMVLQGSVPLYSLINGTRYRYIDKYHQDVYTFVKHAEYEFPAHFLLKKHSVVYQYKVAIPDSSAHHVIFVDETAIVTVLEFL